MKALLSLPGIHFLASRYGPESIRSAAFNAKFQSGDWGCDGECPTLARIIESYANGGSILSLGCGANQLGAMLDVDSYSSFTGVDVSIEALNRAKLSSSSNMRFVQSDLEDLPVRPPTYDVILFPESLYYVPLSRLDDLLSNFSDQLNWGGHIIATFSQPERHAKYLKRIREVFRVKEQLTLSTRVPRQVIIFQ